MNTPPPSGRPSGIDPLLRPQAVSVDRPSSTSPGSRPRRANRPAPRRRHPAGGARALALSASVVATGAVAVALAYSEGASSIDAEATDRSTDQPNTLATVDPPASTTAAADTTTPADSTPDSAVDTGTSATSSTAAASTTTPQTTEPADPVVGASGYADGEYLGTAEYTEWGDVQVQVTISDGAIVDVAAVQFPTGRRSSSINDGAVPMLEADAIAQQSSDLDVVSGATYTSVTYADSLQAALDQAAVAAEQESTS